MSEHDLRLIELGQQEERKAIVDWLRKSGYNQIAYCIEKEAHKE